MATSVISNTILDPLGVAIANVPVTARLMPSAGFRVDTFTEVARVAETTTNASGFWSLALEENSNITPGTVSTWYEITEAIPNADGGRRVWTIQVGASDQSLLASLVTPSEQQPTVVPPGTTYISQAAGDARYQALSALGSGTPGTETPDHAGTAGVATSASRSDHIHPITAATPVAIGAALAEGSASTFARSDHVHTGPLGTLSGGYSQATANQGGFSAETDLTNLTSTVTVAAGRRIRVSFHGMTDRTVADGVNRFQIKEGATVLQTIDVSPTPAGITESASGSAVLTPSTGAHTYKVSLQRITGTGTVQLIAAATFPAFILVEDIGV